MRQVPAVGLGGAQGRGGKAQAQGQGGLPCACPLSASNSRVANGTPCAAHAARSGALKKWRSTPSTSMRVTHGAGPVCHSRMNSGQGSGCRHGRGERGEGGREGHAALSAQPASEGLRQQRCSRRAWPVRQARQRAAHLVRHGRLRVCVCDGHDLERLIERELELLCHAQSVRRRVWRRQRGRGMRGEAVQEAEGAARS